MTNEHTCSAEALAALKARVDALYLEYVFPVLATIRVGEDAGAVAREEELLRLARAVNVRVRRYILPAEVPEADVTELIREVNVDFLLSALLLIRPMPESLDPSALEEKILPQKRLSGPEDAADPLTLLTRVADAAERNAK